MRLSNAFVFSPSPTLSAGQISPGFAIGTPWFIIFPTLGVWFSLGSRAVTDDGRELTMLEEAVNILISYKPPYDTLTIVVATDNP